MKQIGLIVNPIAGLGGRVGLKGSDTQAIQAKALQLGAVPYAGERAAQSLFVLGAEKMGFRLLAYPRQMGAGIARQVGMDVSEVGTIPLGGTTSTDTIQAAYLMLEKGVDLLLFAGGDGTARDICHAVGIQVPVLGIPAGVKIQSAVFATHPRTAGELVAAFLRNEVEFHLAEVVDLDEDAYRQGRLSSRLFGYLHIPYARQYVQGGKIPAPPTETAVLEDIASDLGDRINPGWLYIWGPGSTTHAVAACMGIQKTLLGVDVVVDGKIIAVDVNESHLLHLLSENAQAEIVITPIGGQGCLLGRGNQPISPQVIRKVGRAHIRVISTPEKIQQLAGAPLWVDTGDAELDKLLSGYLPILTGYKESIMYKVSA